MPKTIDEYAYDVFNDAISLYGLMRVLDKIALICHEKEEAALSNGQGETVASSWRRMKNRLEVLANREDGPLY